jgi:transcriptional regulator with XRE-family HTH domain
MRKAADMEKLNDRLRTAREKRGWTQAEAAEQIGTTSLSVSRWENGITFPSPYYRKKLSALYATSARELGLTQESEEEQIPGTAVPAFIFNEPLPAPGELYARQRERKTLVSRTTRKASTSIIGPRRIGKTWLMQYLQLVAPEQLGSRFRISYLDGMSPRCRTVTGFVTEALSKLGLSVPEVIEGLETLDRGLQELLAQKLIPVLCIDEFERISRREEFSLDFFEGLRAMTSTSDLVLIIASKSPLRQVVDKRSQGSPFFNIFEQISLKPFTYSDTEQFIFEKGNVARFQSDERQYLWTYGRMSENEHAWWPLRLQLAGKILVEDLDQVRKDPNYRQSFEERFHTTYQAVI